MALSRRALNTYLAKNRADPVNPIYRSDRDGVEAPNLIHRQPISNRVGLARGHPWEVTFISPGAISGSTGQPPSFIARPSKSRHALITTDSGTVSREKKEKKLVLTTLSVTRFFFSLVISFSVCCGGQGLGDGIPPINPQIRTVDIQTRITCQEYHGPHQVFGIPHSSLWNQGGPFSFEVWSVFEDFLGSVCCGIRQCCIPPFFFEEEWEGK